MTEETQATQTAVDPQANDAAPLQLDDNIQAYIAKLVQKETDKVRTEYSKKLKSKEEIIKDLEAKSTQSMTEAEKLAYEKEQFEQQMNEQMRKFTEQKSKFTGTQLLHKYGLADENLSFLPFIMDADEEVMAQKCETLKGFLDNSIKQSVEQRFKDHGRNPSGSDATPPKPEDEAAAFGKKLAQAKAEQSGKATKAAEHYFGSHQ